MYACVARVTTLIDIATEVVNDFLDEGKGRLITEASRQPVNPAEVAGLDIDGSGKWAVNILNKGDQFLNMADQFEGRDAPTARDLQLLMSMLGISERDLAGLMG
jgi:hypothetical protein